MIDGGDVVFVDMLHSPDFVVDDVRGTVSQLVSKVGLPEPDPDWYQCFPAHAYEAVFARVSRSRTAAPSRLEVISSHPVPEPADPSFPRSYIDEMAALQGARPVKTHATVITTSRFEELMDFARARGLRHRIDPPSPELTHLRLWVGVSEDDPAGYRPDDDAGIMFEAIPTQCLLLSDRVFERPAPRPVVEEGAMARVEARAFLTAEADRMAAVLGERLAWPVASEEVDSRGGCRRVRMATNLSQGAGLELVEPRDDVTHEARFLARWGPGAYAVRISVNGLDAKADDLRRRGTRFEEEEASSSCPRRLRIDVDEIPGVLLELVDLEDC